MFFFVSLFIFSSCEVFEDYDKRTYYDVEGEGYVYNKYTKEPMPYAIVGVNYNFEGRRYGTVQPGREELKVDEIGHYYVKFLKRTHKSDVVGYSVCANADNNKLTANCISISIEELEKINSANKFNIDTLWLH